ncbi:hypothetical protein WJX72_010723 [[Myrmecia] bisecta]|uniref:Nucleoside phosphorylase domain-containing protein n=1 Tax=[Myrmecia] bisecta TaxID=41462 RepID=A0AAW1NY67_9CHLO
MHLKRLLSAFVFFTVIASCGAQRRSAAGRRLRPRTAQQSTRRLTALHVGYVLGRLAEEGRFPELHVSITSLLFHASCPIHLHFATDNQSEAFLTAALPNMPAQLGFKHQVDWKFVDGHAVMGATMQAVQQTRAGSQFYHAFAHYKVSPEKLFPGVDRMLLLDFDTLVISDMCTVSNGVFAEMHSQQTLLAMAAEMHPTYVPGAEYHFLTYLLPAHLKDDSELGAIWWLFTDLADLSEVYVKNPKYAAGQAVIMSSAERATAMRACPDLQRKRPSSSERCQTPGLMAEQNGVTDGEPRHPRASTKSDTAVKTVLVLIAMEAEASPLVETLGTAQDEPPRIPKPAPCVSFSGTYKGLSVHVVHNGKCRVHGVDNVGTVPAALTAYLAIQEFKPDLVISAGTAGGFKSQGAAIADVFVSTAISNHDRHIPIPNFDAYGIWAYDPPETPNLVKALGLKTGLVSSGNALTYSIADMALMQGNNAAIKEMEAAGIAWAAHLFDVPLLAIKAVTDIVDGERAANEEFLENLHRAAQALQETIPPILEFIAGKRVSDL